jgi:hypothetical protein
MELLQKTIETITSNPETQKELTKLGKRDLGSRLMVTSTVEAFFEPPQENIPKI